MSVDTKHSSYTANETNWKFMRDCIEGDSAIKAGGTSYVPQLSGQTTDEYKAYIGRPYFEGYTQRVLDGKTGLMFAKSPLNEAPKTLEDLYSNFDLNGSTLTDYVQDIGNEVESVGRVGCLVDMGKLDDKNRPYAAIYQTETIINHRYENINNQNVLTLVVLEEIEDKWVDTFTSEPTTIYRVLLLIANEDETVRHYEQHIYRPRESGNSNSQTEYDIEIIVPLMNGQPLVYIPFVSITPEKLTIVPAKPPLLDLARENLAHFKLNVDYYHGMHFTALPTPYGVGIQLKANETFSIGSTKFNFSSNANAKLAYLEFEGKGLETLENEKEKLIDSMVVLGSNMLQGDKKTAEAENTVAMRSAGQNASLISTADTISRGVTRILEIMAEWMGISGEIKYSLNTDYNLTQMSPQLLKEIIVGKTLGEIPRKVVYENLKAGEIIDEDMTFDEFETMLSEEAPVINNSALPAKPSNNEIDLKKIADSVGAK